MMASKRMILAGLAGLALGIALIVPASATPALAQTVDLGATDLGAGLSGWSNPVSVLANGGSYGNLAGVNVGACDGSDNDARLVFGTPAMGDNDADQSARITLAPEGLATSVTLCHLDGVADDSLKVEVLDENGLFQPVATYLDAGPTETWVSSMFDLTPFAIAPGPVTLRITSTAAPWAMQTTYGQLAIDYVELDAEPFVDFVNIGTPASEGAKINNFGPIQPTTSGGNWGGMGAGTCGVNHEGYTPAGPACDDLTRAIWAPGDGRGALVKLANPGGTDGLTLAVRHLDGLADDSFTVWVKAAGVWHQVGTVTGEQDGVEDWHVSTFDLSTDISAVPLDLGRKVFVRFTATGNKWSGFATYGQVAIDWVGLVI